MKCNLLIQPKIFNLLEGHLELELHDLWLEVTQLRFNQELTDGSSDGRAFKHINLIKDRSFLIRLLQLGELFD